jgi:hypothetical protein
MKQLTEEQFMKKLKKLLTKEIPNGIRVVYDTHQLRLFVIREGFDFVDKDEELRKKGKSRNDGTSWHGVLTPVNEPNGTEGHVEEAVVGYVDVTMEAVMDGDY